MARKPVYPHLEPPTSMPATIEPDKLYRVALSRPVQQPGGVLLVPQQTNRVLGSDIASLGDAVTGATLD